MPTIDASFIFDPSAIDGDRPIQILFQNGQRSNPATPPDNALVIVGALDERSSHEYDYAKQGASVVYVPQEAPGPKSGIPNPRQFQGLVMNDANIPIETRANLMQYFALLEQNANNPSGLQAGWQVLLGAYGSTWLTSDVQSIVETHAVTSNMPLVAE